MADLEKETEIRWVKHGSEASTAILGKDILVFSSGNFITFVETTRTEKKEILYNANTEVKGDGIHCLCTHGTLPCFAFAERCRNPRILVMSFPSFEVIKSFDSVTDTNYLALKFSEMEFLIALTGVPDFKIVIWNWRTSEKLYSQETELDSPRQILRVSPSSPVQILQSTGNDRRLICWDLNICYKKTLLNKKFAQLPEETRPPYNFAFGADGDIYFVDGMGSLYSMNSDTLVCTKQYSFVGFHATHFVPCVTWYKGGIVFTTSTEVLFLKRRSPEGWTKIWSFPPKVPFKDLLTSCVKDILIGISITNDVTMIKGETQTECTNLRMTGADFEFVCFLNPMGDYIITFGNSTRTFNVWNKISGQKVSQLHWNGGIIKQIKSNPRYPYLIAVTKDGHMSLITAFEHSSLLEVEQLYLTDNILHAVRFNLNGERFCVANMDVGEFFLLKAHARMEVVAYLKLNLKIVDYALLEREISGVSLIIVPMSQFCCRSGQTALLFSVNEERKTLEHIKDVPLPSIVTQIIHSPVSPKEIICVMHRSRKIIIVNFLDGKATVEFVSGHQMKLISIYTDGENLLSCCADGLVILRTLTTKKCVTLFSSHHRMAKGIKSLALDPYVSFVAVLGANGSLVCINLKEVEHKGLRHNQSAMTAGEHYKHVSHMPHIPGKARYPSIGSHAVSLAESERGSVRPKKTTWLQHRQFELLTLEERESDKEKESILEEFHLIQNKLRELINGNFRNAPEMQLPLQAFDLDKVNRRKKLEDAKAEKEKEKMFRQTTMKALARLTEVIKTSCWDSIAVKGREIHGISSNITVQSYPLLPEWKDFKETMLWLSERKKLAHFFSAGDFFEPWVPRTDSALELHLNTKFQVSFLDVTQTIKTKYEEEQMEDENTETETVEQESPYAWSGTSTHNFVDVDPHHYNQLELTTFLQSHHEIYFIENDIKKLMLWFNKEFAEAFALKEQEMAFVLERNNRFRHIINELSFFNFSPAICKTVIYDPEWAPEENPESILTVQDHEVKAPVYISQSEMELLRQKQEEERLRLLMADDFRERTLITMMDGVLEKLWEDEIKREIPKPKCMLEKDAENLTEEDLKAIRAYEESVKFLASERERYRKILEGRWEKTIIAVRDSVARFDEKLAKLHILKLKVESAVGQEILKCLRIRQSCFERIAFNRRIDAMKMNIVKKEKTVESLVSELNKLTEMVNECKAQYETLQTKDKNLDRNFKKEFPECSALACEQLYKLSKRRPKLLQKAATFSTVLVDLGKCAVSGIKPEYMPLECIQYLRDIDVLDAYSNAPASVSQQSWETACKLRRMKIETELRMRACAVDLSDAEVTVNYYQKLIKSTKEEHARLQNELQTVRTEHINALHNKQIQLVLKKGLVEIPLTGQISDFDESVLVTKDTLYDVNRAIQKIGQQKIKAMKKAANFRKGIIYKEWEHKKLRMEIEDLKAKLETIEKFQVLKELQAILTARARGFSDEKGFLYLENELAKVKEKFEKAQVEIFSKIDKLNVKIEKMSKKNKKLDLEIMELNVEVNEMNLSKDLEFDKKFMEENLKRMRKVRERSRLVRKIQEQHNEIMVLQTELELQRLRTYPTIKHKMP